MSDFHISNILHPHVSHQNLFKCGYLSRRAWWREIWQLRGHVVACVDGSCLLIQGSRLEVKQVTLDRETPRSPSEDIWFRGRYHSWPGHPAAAPRANLIRQTAGSWFGGEHERGHPSASWWHAVCERHRLEEFGHGVTTERQSLVCVLILKKKCAWIDFLTISFQGRGYRWWQRGHVLCIFSGTLWVTFQRRKMKCAFYVCLWTSFASCPSER